MVTQRGMTSLRPKRTAVVSCSLCGIRLPVAQMVADGGTACADLRWYCRDIGECTQRWTARSAPLTGPGTERSTREDAGAARSGSK
jgi:hypothetical protein